MFVYTVVASLVILFNPLSVDFLCMKSLYETVNVVFSAPLHHILKHKPDLLNFKFSGPTKPQQIIVVPIAVLVVVV